MKRSVIEFVGWYGTIAIVGAYALVSFSLLSSSSLIYQLLNLTGSIGIILDTITKKDYQPATLNVVWAVIAVIAILHLVRL